MSAVYSTIINWTSDSSGNYSGTVDVNGCILNAVFAPGSGGSQPSNNYDVTINDAQGVDILAGLGANLSNTTATRKIPLFPATDGTTTTAGPGAVNGQLTVAVANAGNAKSGTIVLYHR